LRKSMFLAVYVQTLCRGNPDCMWRHAAV
jgi:hypothetical protein